MAVLAVPHRFRGDCTTLHSPLRFRAISTRLPRWAFWDLRTMSTVSSVFAGRVTVARFWRIET